jgi:hypothetical protein
MTIHRFIKSLVSLAAAYSVVCSLFLGSIAAGRAAALPAPLCSASKITDRENVPAPFSRDLACLVSGCCCAPSSFAPVASTPLPLRAPSRIAWQNSFRAQSAPEFSSAAAARAPPALA